MYAIQDEQIREVRVGYSFEPYLIYRKGMLLLSKTIQPISHSTILVMPIMTIDIHTGDIIYRANFFLHNANEIEFLEVFEEYIFIKQQEHRLVIYDVTFYFTHKKRC